MSTRARLDRIEKQADEQGQEANPEPAEREVELISGALDRLFAFSRKALAAADAGDPAPEQYSLEGVRCGHVSHERCSSARWSCDYSALHPFREDYGSPWSFTQVRERVEWPGLRVFLATMEMAFQSELHYYRTGTPLRPDEINHPKRGNRYLAIPVPEYVLAMAADPAKDPHEWPEEFPLEIVHGRIN